MAGATREGGRKHGDWQVDRNGAKRVITKAVKSQERDCSTRPAEQGESDVRSGSGTEWLLGRLHQLNGAYLLGQRGIREANAEQRWHRVPKQRGQAWKKIGRCEDDREHRRQKADQNRNFNRNKSG
jgi:hypothetical protein